MRLAKTPTSNTIPQHTPFPVLPPPARGGGRDHWASARPCAEARSETAVWTQRCPDVTPLTLKARFPHPAPTRAWGFDEGRRECVYSSLFRVNGRPQRPYTWRGRCKASSRPSAPTWLTQGQWLGLRVSTVRAPSFGRGQTAAYTCGARTAASTLQRRPGVGARPPRLILTR